MPALHGKCRVTLFPAFRKAGLYAKSMNRTITPAALSAPRLRPGASLLFALSALALLLCGQKAYAREDAAVKFQRGVHVLRSISPGDHWPPVTVSRFVKVADSTNALLMHKDRNFVLASIATDLSSATASGKFPAAGYFAAHAHSMLGNHKKAAKAMRAYLFGRVAGTVNKAKDETKTGSDFRDMDYLFLVRELYAAGDYDGTRHAAGTWQAMEPTDDVCSEERLTYVWGSYFAENRHRDAMEAVLSDPCASWRGQVFFARSCLALGDEEGAEERIESLVLFHPDKERDIRLLWNRLTAVTKYP